MSDIKKIAILTSGGDAPGMNAAIRALVLTALHFNIEIIGFYHGFNGLLNNEYSPLTERDVRTIIHRGGTILKSARSAEFATAKGQRKAAENLQQLKITTSY